MGIKAILKRVFFEITGGYFSIQRVKKQIVQAVLEREAETYPRGSEKLGDLKYLAEVVAEFVILGKKSPIYVEEIISDIIASGDPVSASVLKLMDAEKAREYFRQHPEPPSDAEEP